MAKFKGGFGGGMPNMNSMLQKAQKMQAQMEQTQKEMEEKEFTVTSGGGAVTIVMNGKREITALTLQPELVDPNDIEMLQDTIITAVNEAVRTIDEQMGEAMSKVTGSMNMPGLF